MSAVVDLGALDKHLRKLGIRLSTWDAKGLRTSASNGGCDLCQRLGHAQGMCARDVELLAQRVISQAKPETFVTAALLNSGPDSIAVTRGAGFAGEDLATNPETRIPKPVHSAGCCLVGVPVYQRRRVVGAAVGSFPTTEIVEDANLRQISGHLHLSQQVVAAAAAEICRHGVNEADDFLNVLSWLLQREQAIASANDDLAGLSDNLTNTYEELSLLYSISSSMKVTRQPADFIRNVCNELLEVMGIEAAVAVLYRSPERGAAGVSPVAPSADRRDACPAYADDLFVLAGSIELNADQIKLFVAAHLANLVAGNKPVLDNHFEAPQSSGLGAGIASFIAAPLSSDEKPIGLLIGFNKALDLESPSGKKDFDSHDLKLISSIANQAAVFLANHALYADMQELLMGVLHALTATIDAKDPYTCGHSQRVALISKRLAQAAGYEPDRVQWIYLCGLLHDIGKIGVPEAVLRKAGKLTQEEYDDLKNHPAIGAKILSGIRQLDQVIAGILTHHERLDGKGYPQGLASDRIPMEGLIVGLADSFDAMTSNRTYRAALPLSAVIEEIRRCSGRQFHPDLVEKLLAMDLEQFMIELCRVSAPCVEFPGSPASQPAGGVDSLPTGPASRNSTALPWRTSCAKSGERSPEVSQ
jgi:HD-GYP domain-containing protein (c-di-GMP phosphodiesterase class II)